MGHQHQSQAEEEFQPSSLDSFRELVPARGGDMRPSVNVQVLVQPIGSYIFESLLPFLLTESCNFWLFFPWPCFFVASLVLSF